MNWALTFECKGRWLGLIDTWPSSKIWVLFQFVEDKLVDYCRLGLFKTLDQRTAALVGWARRYIVGWLGWFPFSEDVDKCVGVCVWVSSSRCRNMKVFRCRHRLFHLPILTNYWILGSQGARDVLCFASRLGAEQFNNFQNHKVFEDHERWKVLCFCCSYYLRPAYAYVGRIVATPFGLQANGG